MTMRSRWAIALMAFAMTAPSLASANDADVERQLQQMQQRMQQMEDKLQATSDQLESANQRVDEQSKVIEDAGLAETRGASNGLPGFLGEITVGGSVAASYFYNTNDPNDADLGGLGGDNAGINGRLYPLHPDHNSFALDAVWFEVEREISEEHRGGFRFDTVYGKTGALLNVGGPNNRDARDDSGFYIHQGYVQYLAPILDGVTFKFGKFGDLFGVGTESANNAYSWNITRGNVWSLFEPIDHIGILAAIPFGDTGLNLQIAGVNGFLPDDPDRNDAKSITGRLGWDSEQLHASIAGIWGGEFTAFDGDESGVVNGTVRYDASERLAFYVNGDYAWNDQDDDPDAWGVAAAGRFGITDRTGIALRGEYVEDSGQFLGFGGELDPGDQFFSRISGVNIWSVTATLDHLLTDNLMIRGEVRYDRFDKDDGSNDEFFHNSSNNGFELSPDQVVLGVEAVYNFNRFAGE
jgi:hypothetical protein